MGIVIFALLLGSSSFESLYERRDFEPLWIGQREAAAALFRAADGYSLDKVIEAKDPVELEEAITELYFQYAGDQFFGRLRKPQRKLLEDLLIGAAARGDLRAAIDVAYPLAPDYLALKSALAEYRALAARGGWKKIPAHITKIKLGAGDASVLLLRERLLPGTEPSEVFDPELEAAVYTFQQRHGLEADGEVGAATLRELNISAEQRAQQIEANLERRRWVGRGFAEKYILVNIPEFMLRAVNQGQVELVSKVIVGKTTNETPFVSTKVTAIELNPDWHVPKNIQKNEVVPEAKKDPMWLIDRGIRAYYGDGDDAIQVDPSMIDWDAVDSGDYFFRQPPGPGNALGRLKLVTPNPFDVYLHDTPQRSLFTKHVRAFSHGCVRVEEPLALAEWVLAEPQWTEGSLSDELDTRRSSTVKVKEPPEVYLVYWTVWADDDGSLRFAPDIYNSDRKLYAQLNQLGARVVSTGQAALRTTRSATLPKRM